MTAILKDYHESGLIKDFPDPDKLRSDERFTGVMPFERDYPGEVESWAECLPQTAKRFYGCLGNCEWRKMAVCPHGFKQGRGHDPKVNKHPAGICQGRINYLLSFTKGYKSRPTFSQWRKDYNSALVDAQAREEFVRFKLVEQKLLDAEQSSEIVNNGKEPDKRLISELDRKRKSLRRDWLELLKLVMGVDIADSPPVQKVEVEVKDKMSLSDMQRIMRKHHNIVDAEFTMDDKDEGTDG